jgi:hypothetical protein
MRKSALPLQPQRPPTTVLTPPAHLEDQEAYARISIMK